MSGTTQQTTPPGGRTILRHLLLGVLIVLLLALVTLTAAGAKASPQAQGTATPQLQPTPTFDLRRLDKPVVTNDNSEQLIKGSVLYWGVCMACHGDRGQGMTDEWRDAYGEDKDCWQSGCHGDDHPRRDF